MEDYDFLFKILLIGDSGVGKSSLLLRFSDDRFSETYMSTIGVDFRIRTIEMNDGKRVKLQIWDTTGQERFKNITSSYYRGSHAIIMVYDVTDLQSFTNIAKWREEIDKYAHENVEILLIGNKNDLVSHKVIDYSTGKDLADKMGVKFLESSARTGDNVVRMFLVLSEILREIHGAKIDTKCDKIQLTSNTSEKAKKGCC